MNKRPIEDPWWGRARSGLERNRRETVALLWTVKNLEEIGIGKDLYTAVYMIWKATQDTGKKPRDQPSGIPGTNRRKFWENNEEIRKICIFSQICQLTLTRKCLHEIHADLEMKKLFKAIKVSDLKHKKKLNWYSFRESVGWRDIDRVRWAHTLDSYVPSNVVQERPNNCSIKQ